MKSNYIIPLVYIGATHPNLAQFGQPPLLRVPFATSSKYLFAKWSTKSQQCVPYQ